MLFDRQDPLEPQSRDLACLGDHVGDASEDMVTQKWFPALRHSNKRDSISVFQNVMTPFMRLVQLSQVPRLRLGSTVGLTYPFRLGFARDDEFGCENCSL